MKWLKISNSADGKQAVIDISGTIGYEMIDSKAERTPVAPLVKEISEIKAESLQLDINSFGGDFNDAIEVYKELMKLPIKKITNLTGSSASAATLIAMAGTEITMLNIDTFLIHQCSLPTGGTEIEMEQNLALAKKINKIQAEIYSERTGLSVTTILALMAKNNGNGEWMSAQEAKKLGFVDSVIKVQRAAASVSKETLKAFRLPELPKQPIQISFDMTKFTERFAKLTAAFKDFVASAKAHELKDGKKINIDESVDGKISVGDTVTDESGQPTPSATYTLKDETVIKTDADSKVSEVTPKKKEEPKAPEMMPSAEVTAMKAELETLKTELATIKATATVLKTERDTLQLHNDGYDAKLEKYEAIAKTITTKGNPPSKDNRFRQQPGTKTERMSDITAAVEARKAELKAAAKK